MEVYVKTDSKNYTIYIENGFENLQNSFNILNLDDRKICIITDTNVDKIYSDELIKVLSESKHIYKYVFQAGEKNKSQNTLNEIYSFFLENKIDRKSIVIALGGGVVGDIVGFAASSYMRGLPFINIPTTLLSQIDSSVGGKTGINFQNNKNIIGAFYQPEFVYINLKTLETLPKCEFSFGMVEAIKHGLVNDLEYFKFILENKENINNLQYEYIEKLVASSCKIKSDIVSKDEREKDIREILNFGHTFGHAIESISNFNLSHGQSVSLGMVCALNLSLKLGYINIMDIEEILSILKYFKLPTKLETFSKEEIYEQMFLDKKTFNNKINIILLKSMGYGYTYKHATKRQILDAIPTIL